MKSYRSILLAAALAAAFVATGAARADSTPGTTPIITAASGSPVDANDSTVSVDVALRTDGGTNSYTVCWLSISPGTGGYSPPGDQIVSASGTWSGTLPIASGATYTAQLLMVADNPAGAGSCPATFDPSADFYYLSNAISFAVDPPPPPSASFSTSTSGLRLSVSDTSTAPYPATIASVSFDYGDGSTGSDTPGGTTTHSYAASGTYDVEETVTDTNGESDSASVQVSVTAPPVPEETPPTSSFSTSKNGLAVTFTDASTAVAPATVASTSLDFGDGSTGKIPPGGTVTHSYAQPGNYTAAETTTDSDGLSAASTQRVVLDAPEASFSTTPTGLSVSFADTSTAAGTASIRSVSFLFGDGQDATVAPGATTAHVYLSAGTFTVVEIVTDSNGLSGQASQTIEISAFGGTPALREKLSPKLTAKVGKAATEPIAVYCVSAWGEAKPERVDGKLLGLSIVGSDQTNLAAAVCRGLLHPKKATGLDLLVAAHEATHALGVASEKSADCEGLRMLPRLERALGVRDRGQRAWARKYVLGKWKKCAP